MIQKNGRKETHECQVINIHVNTAENSYPKTTMYAHSVEKLIQSDLKDAQNAETQLKRDKSNAATVACHFK